MRHREILCVVFVSVVLQFCDLVAGDAAILSNSGETDQLRPFQSRLPPDQRPRLSPTQQHQILSDVQQHQRRYNLPHQSVAPSQLVSFPGVSRQITPKTDYVEHTSFPSLARYRVDRNKQVLQQQQQIQKQQQQQQQSSEPLSFLQTAQTQRYQPQVRPSQYQPTLSTQQFGGFHSIESNFDDQGLQLDEYFEKQRQLELLKKQRAQLILEQQEIKRQQDLLRAQRLAALTSTTQAPTQPPATLPTSYVTTSSPFLLSSPASRKITPGESDLFLKAIATHQKKFISTTSKPTTSKPLSVRDDRFQDVSDTQEIPQDLLSLIQAQQPQLLTGGNNKPQIKIIYQTEKPPTTRQSILGKTKSSQYSSTSSTSSSTASDRDLLLKQLKLALAESGDEGTRNVTTRDLVLPNGKKLQVIQAPNGLSSIVPNDGSSQFQTVTQALRASPSTTTTTTTIRPAKAIFDELTKGVLPPGADFEVLRHKDDGKLEGIGGSSIQNQPGKKVTFVVLEEQADGSYKVQGVKGNSGKDSGQDVQSIVDRIKKGELKLPPRTVSAAKKETTASPNDVNGNSAAADSSASFQDTKIPPTTFRPGTGKYSSSTFGNKIKESSTTTKYFPFVTVSPNSVSQPDNYVTSASTKSSHIYNSLVNLSTTPRNSVSRYESGQDSSRYTTPASSSRYETSQGSSYTTAGQGSSRYETSQPSRYTTANNPSTRHEDNHGSSRYTTPFQQGSRYEDNQGSSKYTASTQQSSRYEDNQGSPKYTAPTQQSSRYEDNQGSSRYQNPSTATTYYESQDSSRYTTANNPSSRYEDNQKYTTVNFPRSSSTVSPLNDAFSTTSAPTLSTTFPPQSSSYVHFTSNIPTATRTSASTYTGVASENLVLDDFNGRVTVPSFLESTPNTIQIQETMTNLMRREGLFAMAKYLRQSGLDTVLNETGPYTIFVPTDKAFRTLLVQLGGPEKAEQKFKENPRLLSGLLLHHVIPGAFRIESLQDEMTGVSLAGTQLRVNVYDMHDHEWNDVKVTTINGAKVAPNKRDIEIPQGIAHAVDRVMFPLPVGDLTQTLQADRERRFGTFLKILHASGLEDTLAGTKTFTVFAPTDTAFTNAASQNGRPVWSESDGLEAAKDIISRHVIPTTLYTGGMRYYHQRDTLRPQVSVSIHKNGGRVRVNEAHVVTHNVPATNGVIHAIDGVL